MQDNHDLWPAQKRLATTLDRCSSAHASGPALLGQLELLLDKLKLALPDQPQPKITPDLSQPPQRPSADL